MKSYDEDISSKGYKMVKEQFSWEKIAEEYINIYRTILKEN